MDEKERGAIVQELALVKGYNISVFERYTDAQLENELRSLYQEESEQQ